MEKKLEGKNDKPGIEPTIIPDECGDTLWDAVLEQEIKTCRVDGLKHSEALLKKLLTHKKPIGGTEPE
jgi:hypothetical protein